VHDFSPIRFAPGLLIGAIILLIATARFFMY
jgi:hypothetical protein